MNYVLVRHKFADFSKWKASYDARVRPESEAGSDSGVTTMFPALQVRLGMGIGLLPVVAHSRPLSQRRFWGQ